MFRIDVIFQVLTAAQVQAAIAAALLPPGVVTPKNIMPGDRVKVLFGRSWYEGTCTTVGYHLHDGPQVTIKFGLNNGQRDLYTLDNSDEPSSSPATTRYRLAVYISSAAIHLVRTTPSDPSHAALYLVTIH